MHELFTNKFIVSKGISRPATAEYLQRTYEREIKKIKDYFNSRVYAVVSNHLLCRIINTAVANVDQDIYSYMRIIETRSDYIAKHFMLTNEINYGILHPGIFYGKNVREIILAHSEYVNYEEASANWKDLCPVTVLDHPRSDLSLAIPDGKATSEHGLATINIDIPLLLLMYRAFLLRSGEMNLGPAHFVHMYVLPAMLKSQANITIVNRLVNISYGVQSEDFYRAYPFAISDYSKRIDILLDDILDSIRRSDNGYVSFMMHIPGIGTKDSLEALRMPDMTPTRQVWWALILARAKIAKTMIDTVGTSGASNRLYYNQLKIDIKRILNDRVYRQVLGRDQGIIIEDLLLSMLVD